MIGTEIRNHIKSLPPEVWCKIFSSLSLAQLMQLREVAFHFKRIIDGNMIFFDSQNNREWAAKKILFTQFEEQMPVLTNALKHGVQRTFFPKRGNLDWAIEKITDLLYKNLINESLPKMVSTFSLSELVQTARFICSPAGKKINVFNRDTMTNLKKSGKQKIEELLLNNIRI